MNNEQQASLEQKVLDLMGFNTTARAIEHNKKLVKESIGKLMKEAGETELRVRLDDTHDAKATVSTRRKKVFDAESLATDLGVAVSAVNEKGFLIKAVQEGRLTLEQYEGYFYFEEVETVAVRKVKA